MAPTLCLITDRRRLARTVGVPLDRACTAVVQQVVGAIRGGVDVVQVREPDLDGRTYVRLVRAIIVARSGAATRVLVNDRADVAIAAGADGIHLRETSVTVANARRLFGPDRLVGRSVHDVVGTGVSTGAGTGVSTGGSYLSGADYLIAGTVFETESKRQQSAMLGLNGLRHVVEAARDCPVWAIGGMTPERVAAVIATGARGIAAIGGFIPDEPSEDLALAVEKLAKTWRFSFDSAVQLS
jgi:thiamine-phosphate pyrophosphorylase